MVEWNVYKLQRVYKIDRHEKPKLDGHQEVLVGTIEADDRTEAQLLMGAIHGENTFVCSKTSDRQHSAIIAKRVF